MKKVKKALSLINLIVISIIIVVIGTVVVVLCVDALDLTGNTKEKFKTSLSAYNSALDTYKGKMYVQTAGNFSEYTLSANINGIYFNGEEQSGNIFSILPSLEASKFSDKIVVTNGKIDVSMLKKKYIEWAKEELGDNVITEEVVEEVKEKRTDIGEGTNIIEQAMEYKIPYVPDNFNYIEGTTIENGYVIVDKFGNEYVWVPVKNVTTLNEKIFSNSENYKNLIEEFNTIKKSIALHGGFYIGRYEASNINGKVSSQKDMVPWINIKWGDSIEKPGENGAYGLAKNVAFSNGYSEFASTLLYDLLWDATLEFMGVSNDKDSLKYGNYNASGFDIENPKAKGSKDRKEFESVTSKTINSRMLLTTGATTRNCKKNIYDIAGNVSEWVVSLNSLDGSSSISRGSDYYELSNSVSAGHAVEKNVLEQNSTIGFRVALYIK